MEHVSPENSKNAVVSDIMKAVVAVMMPVVKSLEKTVRELQVMKPEGTPQANEAVQRYELVADELQAYSKRDNILIQGVEQSKRMITPMKL